MMCKDIKIYSISNTNCTAITQSLIMPQYIFFFFSMVKSVFKNSIQLWSLLLVIPK